MYPIQITSGRLTVHLQKVSYWGKMDPMIKHGSSVQIVLSKRGHEARQTRQNVEKDMVDIARDT